jgi:uncharacterized membrane-anchored protein
MKPYSRLALLFALQVFVLVLMVADRQWTLASGTRVVLETEPLDPRSLFSGDYVNLRYKVSHLPLPADTPELRRHDTVYVTLEKAEPYWRPVAVHRAMPAVTSDRAILRGEIMYVGSGSWDRSRREPVEGRYAELRYGVETYFVPENEGRDIERPVPGENVSVRIAIDAHGRAAIQALLVNGKEKYVEQLF